MAILVKGEKGNTIMSVPKGDAVDEKILIPIGISVVGWILMLFGYVYHQGRKDQRVVSLEEKVNKDEVDFTTAIKRLEDAFLDGDGNSRLMPVAQCMVSREGCKERFDRFEDKIDKRDNEMFERMRVIEKSTTSISATLEVYKRYPIPLTENTRP